jgi:hypothetical protein
MATQAAPVQLIVVPDAQTQKEIENIIDAPRKVAEAIEAFKENRADDETKLATSLRELFAAEPPNVVDRPIAQYEAWKVKDGATAEKIKTCEELLPIIENFIQELKATQGEAMKAAIRRKLDQLQEAAKVEIGKAKLIEEQIENLTKLLRELEKPASARKSKKE